MSYPYRPPIRLDYGGHTRPSCYFSTAAQSCQHLYGEGMAIAAISRVLEVKLGTVYEWVKKSPVGPGDLGLGDHAAPAVGRCSSHIF